jgi:photosystem II stability/assembly factor-like uncharacterized protein
VWHTDTAGSTWQVQWAGAGSPLSISATDPAHAWALIACTGRHPSCGRELLATTDGGRHWRVAATLPAAVNLVQFFSDRLGVATSDGCLADRALSRCPGQVLVSRNGGARWTAVLSAAGPVFATASVTGQLWAAETVPSTYGPRGPSASRVNFLTSTDGGRSWHQRGQLANLGPLTPAVEISLTAIAPGTPGLTWASVFDPLSCGMHGCAVAELLHSGDDGRSWVPASLRDAYPDECSYDGIVFSAAPDGSAWAAAGRNGGACAPPFGLAYRYGASGWQQLPPGQLAQISSLAAVSQDVAYAISDQGVLARTDDGGQRWTQLLPAAAPTGQVDAVSTTTALAARDSVNAGAILRSDNAGRSWTQLAVLPGVVTQLDFTSGADGVAATYREDTAAGWQLWRTWNGGSTWQPTGPLPGTSADIDGPWMSADGHGLLLTVASGTPWEPGSGGVPPLRVWTTSDYGLTWDRGALLPLGGDTLAGPASFAYAGPGRPGPRDPARRTGPMARWAGWLVISTASFVQRVAATDGGPLRLLPAGVPAGDVQLISPGTGFAWSQDYTGPDVSTLSLYRTTNGGRSWQHSGIRLVIPATSQAAPLLDFSDASHGWLVLGNRTWHTADGGRSWTRV